MSGLFQKNIQGDLLEKISEEKLTCNFSKGENTPKISFYFFKYIKI